MKILKHCATRWLSLEKCVKRILQQWPALRSYFLSHEDSEKPGRIKRCSDVLQNDEMKLYFGFLEFILPTLNEFNTTFQAGESMIGHLHNEMTRLLRKLMGTFVLSRVITSEPDITKVEFTKAENQHDNSKIAIGWTARGILNTDENIPPEMASKFFRYVRMFYGTVVKTMVDKFPFKDEVLTSIAYLNPQTRQNVVPDAVVKLAERFLPRLSTDDFRDIEEEAQDYILTPDQELPELDENFSLLNFWASLEKSKLPNGKLQFSNLCKLSRVVLSLPHSNADTERTFSILRKIQRDSRDNLTQFTIESLLSIKLNNTNICSEYNPKLDVLKDAKKACVSYMTRNVVFFFSLFFMSK